MKANFKRFTLQSLGACLALASLACQSTTTQTTEAANQPDPPAVAQAPDDSYVTLSGTVVSADDSAFVLDYGDGVITVEMDDWDWFPEGQQLIADDQVVVYGYVDDDFYEMRTIEASSVYVEDLGTQFYASGADEEDLPVVTTVDFDPRIHVSGTVQEIKSDEFVLRTDGGDVDVNVESMVYDPLDDEGYQRIRKGDRVYVTGELGRELFDDMDLMADSVITLQQHQAS